MRKGIYWPGSAGVMILAVGVLFFFLLDRKPMAINLVNLLRDTPQTMLENVQKRIAAEERFSWEAVQYYNDRFFLSPADIGAVTSLGYLFVQLKEYEKALLWYKKAFDSAPEMLGFRYNLAFVYYKLGRVQEAVGLLSKIFDQPLSAGKDGFVSFIGAESQNEQNTRRLLTRIVVFIREKDSYSSKNLSLGLDSIFEEGLFYFAFLRRNSHQTGLIIF